MDKIRSRYIMIFYLYRYYRLIYTHIYTYIYSHTYANRELRGANFFVLPILESVFMLLLLQNDQKGHFCEVDPFSYKYIYNMKWIRVLAETFIFLLLQVAQDAIFCQTLADTRGPQSELTFYLTLSIRTCVFVYMYMYTCVDRYMHKDRSIIFYWKTCSMAWKILFYI